jgi:hypothetical protein
MEVQRMLPQNIEQIDEAVIFEICVGRCPEAGDARGKNSSKGR